MTDERFTNDRYQEADHARISGLGAGLRRLHDLDDYEVADGDPDIRGWQVRTVDGQKLGTVDDLIVSVSELRVRYLDIDAEGGGHALIPIEAAQLNGERDDVLVHDVSAIRRNYDRSRVSERPVARQETAETGRSQAQASDVGMQQQAESSRMQQSAPVQPAALPVAAPVPQPMAQGGSVPDRTPFDRQRLDAAAVNSAQEIRVPVLHEEAIVQKRPVVREEIVIRRRMVVDNTTVEADLRRERVDVDGAVDRTQPPRTNP